MFLFWIHHKLCSEHIHLYCFSTSWEYCFVSVLSSGLFWGVCSYASFSLCIWYLVLPDVFPCHFSSLPPNSSLEPPAAPAQLSHHGRLIAFYIYISMPIYLNIKNNLPCLLKLVPFSQRFPIHRITAGTLWDSISIFLSIVSEQPHQSCLFDIILLLTKCLKARTNFLDNIGEPVYSDQLEFPVPKLT